MNPSHGLAAYRSAKQTLSPLYVVVQLFDEILVCLRSAGEAAESGDLGVLCDCVSRAAEILRGLMGALDRERGGALAERLRDSYESNMLALVATVGRPDAPDRLRRIGDGLRELRAAWREIADRPEARNVGPIRR